MNKWKIGVVGTVRGITFIDLLQTMGEQACLYAICEADKEKSDDVRKKVPETVKLYSDYDEFLDSGLDAVILCNFFHEHTSYAIKAMNKGIHVLSETTAAPTLGGCVELCRTVERTKAKYMLGANASFKRSIRLIRQQYEEGKLGELFYGEAEYLHCSIFDEPWEETSDHWRRMLPGTYYNMHTLGPLMYATNTMPKKVTARVIQNQTFTVLRKTLTEDIGAVSLCEMDNGAVFNVTGCCNFGPTSKWFRLIGENGVLETRRYDETTVYFASSRDHFYPDEPIPEIEEYHPKYAELNMVSEEEYGQYTEEQMKLGHGGIDFWMLLHFIKYLNGEHEPFFNVYRAAAISATAILGWRSVLNQSKEYTIPDFSKEEERKAYENDFFSPFEEEGSPNFMPRKVSR